MDEDLSKNLPSGISNVISNKQRYENVISRSSLLSQQSGINFQIDKQTLARLEDNLSLPEEEFAKLITDYLESDEFYKNVMISTEEAAKEAVADKNKTLTINYFGNIQDQLIGQIKTKIPISQKHYPLGGKQKAVDNDNLGSFRPTANLEVVVVGGERQAATVCTLLQSTNFYWHSSLERLS